MDTDHVATGLGIAVLPLTWHLAKLLYEQLGKKTGTNGHGPKIEEIRIVAHEAARTHAHETVSALREHSMGAVSDIQADLVEMERRGDQQRTQFFRTQEMQTELLRQQTRLLESIQHELTIHGSALRGIADRMERQ